MLLKDKVVIVSGIGPGLGQELSTLAAAEGAAGVVLAARTSAKLDAAEAETITTLSFSNINFPHRSKHGTQREIKQAGPAPQPGVGPTHLELRY